jgi:pimeloyl-ACP methyl ester carboxylesterase
VIVPRHTLEIAENIKKSNLWILPNSGHSTPVAYKHLFNQTVHTFFTTPYLKKEKGAKFY